MIYGLCITLALANRDSTTWMEGSTLESNGGSNDGQICHMCVRGSTEFSDLECP